MPQIVPIRRALISVSDKTDIVAFARSLEDRGVEIVSTGGTARTLTEAGINVRGIEAFTGFPEMMDGRVKTLHPRVHGGLLARRDDPAHVKAMEAHGIEGIDLICINLYPFEQTVLKSGVTEVEAIEQIDIGGPSMVRSAAKNFRWVTVVTAPSQYDIVVNDLNEHDGGTSRRLRRELATAAFALTSHYDTAISSWMENSGTVSLPSVFSLTATRKALLRYGENPHQEAAVYADPTSNRTGVVTATMLHGKPLSYNNLNDAAAAMELAKSLARLDAGISAVVVKHANACGAALGANATEAFHGAWKGDPLAAFGGILAIGAEIDESCAAAICDGEKFLEVIVAPAFSDVAVEHLGARWKNVRLLQIADFDDQDRGDLEYRSIPGGLLVQDRDVLQFDPAKWTHAAGPVPDDALLQTAAIAWTVVASLKSNAIAIAGDGRLLGAGCGQVDRLSAARHAVERAGDAIAKCHSVAASDAFFPFSDGPQVLIDGGVSCIVQPGGSKRDDETLALCDSRGITCLLTGMRHFKH
jgi:phosphoribosylaminoimidazolecarboxamide formyltransferase/IMP cyclohydrolase